MYTILITNECKRQLKLMKKQGKDLSIFDQAVLLLNKTGTLPVEKYKTHKLSGIFSNHWEAHLEPDWLLIWKINKQEITITLTNTGTHSDLFE